MLRGCLGGRLVRTGFLGPPRVLSSVATSEGPFVCPFIQKSGCNCIGYKATVGPDFPPLPVAREGEGFPGSSEGSLLPLLDGQRDQAFYFWAQDLFILLAPAPLSPGATAIHTGR